MTLYLRFGNGSVSDIEKHLNITFTEADRAFFENSKSEIADFSEPDRWHLFESPRILVLGSITMYNRVRSILSKYSPSGSLQVTWNDHEDSLPESFFEATHVSGYPNFLVRENIHNSYSCATDFFASKTFYQLVKVNKVTLVYKMIDTASFYSEVLGLDHIISDIAVPKALDSSYSYEKSVLDARIPKSHFDNSDKLPYIFMEYRDSFLYDNKKDISRFSVWSPSGPYFATYSDYKDATAKRMSEFESNFKKYKEAKSALLKSLKS